MRHYLLLLTICLSTAAHAQLDTLRPYLDAGIRKHDAGEFEAAIHQYDYIISIDPHYYLAWSEKSFSLFKAEKYQDCIALCKNVLKIFPDSPQNGNIYTNYASALDAAGNSKEAIKVYTEGIKKFPAEHMLFFNRGITEYGIKELDPAMKDFEASLLLNPGHPGSNQALGYCVYESNRVAAAMALTTFLLVEPTGPRAEKNLALLNQLFHQNVKNNNDSNVTISLNPDELNTKAKRDDDFNMTQLTLTLSAAMDAEDAAKGKTPAQLLQKKLEILAVATPTKRGFFSHFYIPLLAGLNKVGLLEAASHVMYLSAKNSANNDWLTANDEKVRQLQEYVNKWNHP